MVQARDLVGQMLADFDSRMFKAQKFNLDDLLAQTKVDRSWTKTAGGKSSSASSSGTPLWMNVLNALGAPGGAVTNTIANWTNGKLDWKDLPFAESYQQFGQGIAENFNNKMESLDDGFQFKDVNTILQGINPLGAIGSGLANVGKNSKGTQEILSNIGWEEKENDDKGYNFFKAKKGQFDLHDLTSFLGDVALDPTTYLTLGGASAIKAGQKAMQSTTKRLNNLDGLSGRTKEIAEKMIADAGAKARQETQNSAFSFDVPFTKFTKSFGGSATKTSDRKIGVQGAHQIKGMLDNLNLNSTQQKSLLKQVFGTDKAEDITLQGYRYLQDNIDKIKPGKNLPDFETQTGIKSFTQTKPITARTQTQTSALNNALEKIKPIVDRNMNSPFKTKKDIAQLAFDRDLFGDATLDDIMGLSRRDLDGLVTEYRSGRELTDEVFKVADEQGINLDALLNPKNRMPKAGDITKARQIQHMKDVADVPRIRNEEESVTEILERLAPVDKASNAVSGISRFQQDMVDGSIFGNGKVGKVLNPRTFGTGETLVDDAAPAMRDADGQIHSRTRLMEQDLKGLQSRMKGFDDADQKNLIHLLEDDFPEGMTRDDIISTAKGKQLDEASKFAKGILDRIGATDMKSGTLDRMMQNYFPHVFKKTDAEIEELAKKFADDADFQKLLGRSAGNTSNKERKSFKTIAEADRFMAKLSRQLEKETDVAKRTELEDKLSTVSGLFERDPIKAIANRYYKSIRSKAMKELQDQFVKDGLMSVPGKTGNSPKAIADAATWKTLDDREAKALGLPMGTKIHPEVLKGLEKTRELFTDEGMNKLMKHLDTFQNGWKMLVTTYVPAHHVRNLIGNLANAALGGNSVTQLKQTWSLLSRMRNGTTSEADRKLLEEMADNGVLNQGFVADFTGAKTQGALYDNPWAKTMRNFGELTDNIPRVSLYLTVKSRTGSTKIASQQVRKFLFNYHELTGTDKAIRRIAPFWTWTKNNLPLQIEQLAKQPRFYLTYEKFKEALNGEDQEDMPAWMKEGYLQIPGTNEMFNPGLPMNDLTTSGRDIVSMLSPFIKAPFEVATNKQVFNDRPISYDAAQERRGLNINEDTADIAKYLGNTFGGVVNRGINTGIGAGQGLTTGDWSPFYRELAGLLAGKPVELRE